MSSEPPGTDSERADLIPFRPGVEVLLSVKGRVYSDDQMQLLKVRNDYQELKASYSAPSSGPLWGSAGIAIGGGIALFSGTFTDVYRFAAVLLVTLVTAGFSLHFWRQAQRERRLAAERFKRLSTILDPEPK